MRRVVASVCLSAVGCLLPGGEVAACGDKLLVVDRHVRSQRAHGAVRRASILVFLGEREDLRDALREMGLERELTLAGHTVRAVSSLAELATEIHAGAHDILLADIRDLDTLEPGMLSGPRRPFPLPVVVNATGEGWEEAVTRFSCIRRSPSAEKHYLAVIEEVLLLRRDGSSR